jgi:hypothetical protein
VGGAILAANHARSDQLFLGGVVDARHFWAKRGYFTARIRGKLMSGMMHGLARFRYTAKAAAPRCTP